MMIRFAITLSKWVNYNKTKDFVDTKACAPEIAAGFLFLYFWYLFRNQKQHVVTGILTLMHLADISNRKHLQKSNKSLKLHLKDNAII